MCVHLGECPSENSEGGRRKFKAKQWKSCCCRVFPKPHLQRSEPSMQKGAKKTATGVWKGRTGTWQFRGACRWRVIAFQHRTERLASGRKTLVTFHLSKRNRTSTERLRHRPATDSDLRHGNVMWRHVETRWKQQTKAHLRLTPRYCTSSLCFVYEKDADSVWLI